jgi:hypothetical protein
MHAHRFREQLEINRLPQAFTPAPSAASFVWYPVAGLSDNLAVAQRQLWIYQQAYEQAQAVVRPSLPERRLLEVWN